MERAVSSSPLGAPPRRFCSGCAGGIPAGHSVSPSPRDEMAAGRVPVAPEGDPASWEGGEGTRVLRSGDGGACKREPEAVSLLSPSSLSQSTSSVATSLSAPSCSSASAWPDAPTAPPSGTGAGCYVRPPCKPHHMSQSRAVGSREKEGTEAHEVNIA